MRRLWTGWDKRVRIGLGALAALVLAGALVALAEGDTGGGDEASSGVATAVADGGPQGGSDLGGAGVPADDFDAAKREAIAGGGSAAPAPPSVGSDPQFSPLPPEESPGGAGATGDQVIRTGSIRVEVAKGGFRAAFDRTTALASELGGFVASSSSERVGERLAAGSLTLRVPSARFDDARRRIAELGTVEAESIHGEDVSGELVDLEARLRSLRAQEDVLRTLLGRARTVGEVIQVEQQLGGVRQQIERLTARQAHLTDQVAMATLQVSLFEKGTPLRGPDDDKSVLERSLERAIAGALAVVGGTVVVIGYAVPLAVLALLAWGLYRLFTRRRAASDS